MAIHARQDDLKRSASNAAGARLAMLCKAAADPLRLDIVRVLRNDTFGVQELATIFAMPQPGMSHHLKVLSSAGLLAARRQGNSIFYRRALLASPTTELREFQASLYEAIDALPLGGHYEERIEAVYRERSAQSRLYFEKNVDRFAENQGMLCDLDQYLPNLEELLDLTALPRTSRVMEVGPGQGQLLRELARRFDKLTALDSSEEMLAFTKKKLPAKDRVSFVTSTLEAYEPTTGEAYDAVILNMVLHHLSSPFQALEKLRRMIRKQGYLVVADLCSHDQEWTRTTCGDVWLGFDPQDVKDWALQAGFAEEQSSYLGLKNGFQIQLKLFHAI